ncbi:MAG: heavy-metal-associated domain-containing protein [Bacteroidota bacterium]
MKTLIIIFISLIFSVKIHAQSCVQTTTISVKGNCDECKERIENAVDIKGVKTSNWDEHKQAITVTYDSKKVTLEQIEMAIAKSGHKTSHQAADLKAYNGLPNCCKYESADCKKKK